MGKGTITGGGTDGKYNLDIVYNTGTVPGQIESLNTRKTELEENIESEEDQVKNNMSSLRIASIDKRLKTLSDIPETKSITNIWCADRTEDLAGEVGSIEVPGESTNILIQPGSRFSSIDDRVYLLQLEKLEVEQEIEDYEAYLDAFDLTKKTIVEDLRNVDFNYPDERILFLDE